MPLQFTDFAHYYDGHSLSEEQQHVHFEAYASLMECIVRLYWREEPAANGLGITLDDDTLARAGEVKSSSALPTLFNGVAREEAPGKKES